MQEYYFFLFSHCGWGKVLLFLGKLFVTLDEFVVTNKAIDGD